MTRQAAHTPVFHPLHALYGEALSAWMDGASLPEGVAEDALLDWLLSDPHAQALWQDFCHVHDAMQEPVMAGVVATTLPPAMPLSVPPLPTVADIAASPLPDDATAANAPTLRWRVVAGLAVVVAADLLAWSLWYPLPDASLSASDQRATLWAQRPVQDMQDGAPPPPAAQATSTTSTAFDAHLDTLMQAHAQLAGDTLFDTPTAADDDDLY